MTVLEKVCVHVHVRISCQSGRVETGLKDQFLRADTKLSESVLWFKLFFFITDSDLSTSYKVPAVPRGACC